jgi:hypothetical protein
MIAIILLSSIASSIIGWLLHDYVPSYFKKKAENRADLQDSGAIARIVEGVKVGFAMQIETTRASLNSEIERLKHQLTLFEGAVTRHEDLKASAYVDFCKSLAEITISQRFKVKSKELEATIALASAKARIAIYGSPEVVKALGEFFSRYGSLDSTQALVCFINAMSLMRIQTVGDDGDISLNALSQIFFGQDL